MCRTQRGTLSIDGVGVKVNTNGLLFCLGYGHKCIRWTTLWCINKSVPHHLCTSVKAQEPLVLGFNPLTISKGFCLHTTPSVTTGDVPKRLTFFFGLFIYFSSAHIRITFFCSLFFCSTHHRIIHMHIKIPLLAFILNICKDNMHVSPFHPLMLYLLV